MKQQVNPIVMIVSIVVALVIVIFFGIRALSPPASSAVSKKPDANRPTEVNGHPVPTNVPYDYMQKPINRGAGGYGGSGVAPNQMPGSPPGQMPHP